MREIKFRGKSIETGEMIYGSLINNMFFKSNTKEPVFYIVDPDQFDDYDSFEDIEHLAVEVDPDTVGQYTGLKDRNGKEIYEGDIADGDHAMYVIFWNEKNAQYMARVEKSKSVLIRHNIFPLWQYVEDDGKCRLEVIGNIFENGELLNDC